VKLIAPEIKGTECNENLSFNRSEVAVRDVYNF